MVKQKLVDILNSGEAWAFVGSGPSIDAGLPSWQHLLEQSLTIVESSLGPIPEAALNQFREHQANQALPEAFSVLKSLYGSQAIDEIVFEILDKDVEPGEITKILARWPFACYATINYDHLLERALELFGGWVPIGNTAAENAKVSGNLQNAVWHPHGGARLRGKNSRLVLASTDYDEIYPGGSTTLSALQAVFRMKQIVFVGFGFKDPDLVDTLGRVGRLITPSRPAFGFLANCGRRDRDDYWRRYKMEIIPYSANGRDHSDLLNLLKAYDVFILDRTTRFGNVSATPEYDMETVGLLTHNRIVKSGWDPGKDATDCISRGLVLAQLKADSPMTLNQLLDNTPQKTSESTDTMCRVVKELIAGGAITETRDGLKLSKKGDKLAGQGKAEYELARDQFQASIRARAGEHGSEPGLVANITETTIRYLERTCRERGLGVAQQLADTGEIESRARAVALLQLVKPELQSAINREAALATIQCVWSVLSSPRKEERRYLGLLTQAYFGRQLLGLDPSAVGIQLKNFGTTVFIVDSNVIIPLLAEGSVGHEYALQLCRKAMSLGCRLVTSDLLLEESVEHARWAWNLLSQHGGSSGITIDAVTGARGYRPNAFLAGYINHPKFGPGASFKRYFAHMLDSDGERPESVEMAECLRKKGIVVQPLDEWARFDKLLFAERDKIQDEIEQRRRNNGTYRHERQVKAEAEVALVVTKVRRRELSLASHETLEAFFLSHSRVVDNLPTQAHRVCLTPESLLEWILSIGELHDDEADAVFDQLLWQIAKDGVDVVPRQQLLRLFHNVVDASRIKLEEVISEHREIVRERYTVDPERAFQDIDPLYLPSAAEEISQEALNIMRGRLDEETRRRVIAESAAKATIKNKEEYERLKAEKKLRLTKALRKKRAAESAAGTGRRKKAKKKH